MKVRENGKFETMDKDVLLSFIEKQLFVEGSFSLQKAQDNLLKAQDNLLKGGTQK